jgi:hypothetical protein
MPTVWKDVEVEIDITLDDFETDELIEELSARKGKDTGSVGWPALQEIYDRRQMGLDYQAQLDNLFYDFLGRIS